MNSNRLQTKTCLLFWHARWCSIDTVQFGIGAVSARRSLAITARPGRLLSDTALVFTGWYTGLHCTFGAYRYHMLGRFCCGSCDCYLHADYLVPNSRPLQQRIMACGRGTDPCWVPDSWSLAGAVQGGTTVEDADVTTAGRR
jgi:hypothetical protein